MRKEIEIESKIKISIAPREKMSKTRGYIYHYVNKQEQISLKKILPCLPKISMGKQQGLANMLPS